ncbi:uncharacterized protein LOC134219271 [Armigeres subalbatus]|uniref:uncharacterized protein LOC134219271 n=1 Tax=Armigeres subalbatus TaxID=124917 RepID=UPI002ED53994
MRKNGTVFHGSTKAIPALLVKKCRKLESAEAAVVELAQKEVSDLNGKKKILKSMKKKKSDSGAKDLNDLCTAIVQKQTPLDATTQQVAASQHDHNHNATSAAASFVHNADDDSMSVETFEVNTALPVMNLSLRESLVQDEVVEQNILKSYTVSDHELYRMNPTNVADVNLPTERQPDITEQTGNPNENVTDLDALIKQAVFDSVNEAVSTSFESYLSKVVEKF